MLPMILGQEKVAVMTQAAQKYAEQFQISHLLKKNPYELSGAVRSRGLPSAERLSMTQILFLPMNRPEILTPSLVRL